ncbi:MAG: hypothetical protein KGL18_08560 [Burkholderiales bacterium]|nr:hypothetical protein [Burkholderiales bacterium]MDE1926454.1 hypothetical protein [Burkholderiales bacterium]MDE2159750.1 hypothetical protein [Burkholderiales bacterium]MDE2503010.1 hypothetical protein [Burkholderiales bacterium]
MIQIEFGSDPEAKVKDALIEACHRRSILIHTLVEDELLSHTQLAIWFGARLPLRLEGL